MESKDLIKLIRLRITVGYLGEKHCYSWWNSAFFQPRSKDFLSPVFGKTYFLAQYHGIKEAASIIHDERIGIGRGVYHLFRLPEKLEQLIHSYLLNQENYALFQQDLANKDHAEKVLNSLYNNNIVDFLGPVKVGNYKALESQDSWEIVSNIYLKSFNTNILSFPFFQEGL